MPTICWPRLRGGIFTLSAFGESATHVGRHFGHTTESRINQHQHPSQSPMFPSLRASGQDACTPSPARLQDGSSRLRILPNDRRIHVQKAFRPRQLLFATRLVEVNDVLVECWSGGATHTERRSQAIDEDGRRRALRDDPPTGCVQCIAGLQLAVIEDATVFVQLADVVALGPRPEAKGVRQSSAQSRKRWGRGVQAIGTSILFHRLWVPRVSESHCLIHKRETERGV